MLTGSEGLESREQQDADILIVGAGAVGLTLAVKLARSGRRVLLLEAGPRPLVQASQGLFEAARSTGRTLEGLSKGRFRMLGGTSNFWGGQLVPLGEQVFAPRPWLRDDTAWPITADDLAPYYPQVFDILGMANVIPTDEAVSARLGQTLPTLDPRLRYYYSRWTPQPNLTAHFEDDLLSSETLHCITDAQVAALIMEGDKVRGVQVVNARGKRHSLNARQVVLANGTIEIARLLLAPLVDATPAPWSTNRWLGRGFMDHLDVTAGRIRIGNQRAFADAFENAVIDGIKYQPKVLLMPEAAQDHFVDIGAHLIFNSTYAEHYENAKIFIRSFLRGRIDRDIRSYPSKIFSLLRFGLPMALRYIRSNRIAITADNGIDLRLTAEQIMMPESGIRLTRGCDGLGLPLIELDWRIDGRELETMAKFTEMLAHSLQGSGIAEIDIDPRLAARNPSFLDGVQDSNHHMGMARMGANAEAGVVDRNLRVFGTANLFVAGAAVYPSSGFPNPTFTAMTLGSRLADHLMAEQIR